jgi:hypothetical protein
MVTTFTVNGNVVIIGDHPDTPLLWVIRDTLGLTRYSHDAPRLLDFGHRLAVPASLSDARSVSPPRRQRQVSRLMRGFDLMREMGTSAREMLISAANWVQSGSDL